MNQFLGELDEIFTGAGAGPTNRWTACNFFDKAVFANSTVPPQYWPKGGPARPIPGLPDTTGWDGVEEFAGHLILWKGERWKWSHLNDFTTWIPVAQTAVSLTVETLEEFTQPETGATTPWIHVDEDSFTFVVGQFVRVDINDTDPTTATYNFYTVAEVADPVGKISLTVPFDHSVLVGSTQQLYTLLYSDWPVGGRLLIDGEMTELEVLNASRNISPVYTSASASEHVPSPGGTFHVEITENPSLLRVGDVLSLGAYQGLGLDLYEIVTVGFNLELRRLNAGTNKQALNYIFPTGTYLTFQPFVNVQNTGAIREEVPASAVLTVQGAVKLTPTGYTGEIPAGTTVPSGSFIASVDANEAGEAINSGSQINGDIYAIVTMGEYAVMLKNRSIQTIQYVGRVNGTFFVRPAVQDEGPIARYAWTRYQNNQLAIWGHKEIYIYGGDLQMTPIGVAHTPDVFAETDFSRADEIVAYHNEPENSVWFVYPTLTGDTKVFIYNYSEKSVVVDLYDADVNGITAVGGVDWEVAETWQDVSPARVWAGETLRWYELVEEGLRRHTIIAFGGTDADPNLGEIGDDPIPRMVLYGRRFSRTTGDNCAPAAYLCKAETRDYDFGDNERWKYVDTLVLEMQVNEPLSRPMKLWVQIGARANLDSDIAWTTPSSVEVSGNGTITTKVNLRASGRYHRIRFFSQAVDAQWRIAGFALIARPGGTN